MRLYKLLRDTPTIKAGTMFREVVSDYDGARVGGLFFMTTSAKRLQYLRLAATTLRTCTLCD